MPEIPDTTATGDAGKIDRILNVLDAFDWELDDRQYALEKIDRIVRDPAPAAAPPVQWADGAWDQCATKVGQILICNRVSGHDGDHIDHHIGTAWRPATGAEMAP